MKNIITIKTIFNKLFIGLSIIVVLFLNGFLLYSIFNKNYLILYVIILPFILILAIWLVYSRIDEKNEKIVKIFDSSLIIAFILSFLIGFYEIHQSMDLQFILSVIALNYSIYIISRSKEKINPKEVQL